MSKREPYIIINLPWSGYCRVTVQPYIWFYDNIDVWIPIDMIIKTSWADLSDIRLKQNQIATPDACIDIEKIN